MHQVEALLRPPIFLLLHNARLSARFYSYSKKYIRYTTDVEHESGIDLAASDVCFTSRAVGGLDNFSRPRHDHEDTGIQRRDYCKRGIRYPTIRDRVASYGSFKPSGGLFLTPYRTKRNSITNAAKSSEDSHQDLMTRFHTFSHQLEKRGTLAIDSAETILNSDLLEKQRSIQLHQSSSRWYWRNGVNPSPADYPTNRLLAEAHDFNA
ncbi:hypothetical protein K470DRAFT_266181 [Piedraia hortae CBS 480.64]|uniref:Uncharacterized protein n=1 Tax=Piedraia hortae CBS 480.64 TaxID=1314780 RepID=A0A6A7BSR3_9PEZI|nr:hypothetical protein K470DRAFT_266181 [Piedraia hortae CBS 480.64]